MEGLEALLLFLMEEMGLKVQHFVSLVAEQI